MGEGIGRTRHQLSRSLSQHSRVSSISSIGIPQARMSGALKARIQSAAIEYRAAYKKYYDEWAQPDSPKLRDSNPSVVTVPGLGLFGFGKNKKEARITTEFFINAIHVMAGANALKMVRLLIPCRKLATLRNRSSSRSSTTMLPFPVRKPSVSNIGRSKKPNFNVCPPKQNSAARSLSSLEEPVESVARSRCCLHERALTLSSQISTSKAQSRSLRKPAEFHLPSLLLTSRADLSSAASLADAANFTISQFGGIDVVVNTAAIYPVPRADGELSDAQWAQTFLVNVTGNYHLARQTEWIFKIRAFPLRWFLPVRRTQWFRRKAAKLTTLVKPLLII